MQTTSQHQLHIPDSLREKILAFRRRVWTIKIVEAVAGAIAGVVVGYLATYALDRIVDTPQMVRGLLFAASIITCGMIPWALDKWVWRQRRLDQLARLLSRKHPSVGDQLLGIIELAESETEQQRSRRLVEAAIAQVSENAEKRDFSDAVPSPKHGRRSVMAALLLFVAVGLFVATAAAARNAWARFSQPWSDVPRYTFAALEPVPDELVIPHGEDFHFEAVLQEESEWKPEKAEVRLPAQEPAVAKLEGNGYIFDLPPQISDSSIHLRVGDYSKKVQLRPTYRPELSGLNATVTLPAYLERSKPIEKEIRGGSFTAVAGSNVVFAATASRELETASVDGVSVQPEGSGFSTPAIALDEEETEVKLEWKDSLGLTSLEPFDLTIRSSDDEAPSLVCEGLPRQKVLLDSEVLTFQIRARDDFGVKRVGIEWRGLDETRVNIANGEKLVGAGNSEAEALELQGAFSAKQFGIEPQPIEMRVYVEDYLPGRERSYSPVCTFLVLNAEEHAIWVTDQLSRWHRMALDVRDREKQLYATNQEIRDLPAESLDDPATRKRIETQAAAERANGRRLSGLVVSGEDLLSQAMRNPEIGVGHLENWAEMMQILKDISGNRMPSVADLLKDGAKAETLAQSTSNNNGPKAGQNLANASGDGNSKTNGEQKPPTQIPTVSDVESTMNQPKPGEKNEPSESKPKQPRLTLPTTNLAGNGKAGKKKPPAGEKVDDAVREQKDLLAEFEKVADELNKILANLEGSTLVKRLKAAARKQQQVASRLGSVAADTFGASDRQKNAEAETFSELADVEASSAQSVSNLMDDMAAYFERSRFVRFKAVLDEMREEDITAGLRYLGDDLRKENGLSIAQAEYWAENLDRWAENLVDVSKCGACPGCKSKGSLPPSIVLEVLQILEGEVKLREQTRVAEQAKPGLKAEEYTASAQELSDIQDGFRERIDVVIERILELPDAQADFGKELRLLDAVSLVMDEATGILLRPETGNPAIAAETEAIELLLQSKRFNPNGGGGGGSTPGGGGGGDTTDSALALVGSGMNENEVREDQGTVQETGKAGTTLPEEFISGLDEYFKQLESPTE
ncbi:MAG: hypothetical protein R3C18_11405 [Planctomycetaceae bacterium]